MNYLPKIFCSLTKSILSITIMFAIMTAGVAKGKSIGAQESSCISLAIDENLIKSIVRNNEHVTYEKGEVKVERNPDLIAYSFYICLGLGLAGTGFLLGVSDALIDVGPAVLFLLGGGGLFFLSLIALLVSLDSALTIVINHDKITVDDRDIYWHEIKNINHEKIRNQYGWLQKELINFIDKRFRTRISVASDMLPISIADFLALVNQYYPISYT